MKPKETDLEPQTVGDHVKRRRLELGLTQIEAGQRLGVTQFTVINWESGERRPATRHWPALLEFLGYDPEHSVPGTLAEQLTSERRKRGWSQRQAAKAFGVDPSTWSSWEAGGIVMMRTHRTALAQWLGGSDADLSRVMAERWRTAHASGECD
ncbi:MAG TPA: helix-turn-helix transcriptional regulator [Burkholderiales bacterium]|nr:helix-turn-helix transcriptional regulator [Burkholderiales bacterium]